MSMVKLLSEVKKPKASELGGKAYALAVLLNNGFNVPKGFVIVSEVFFRFLRYNDLMEKMENLISEIDENNPEEKSKGIKNLILSGKIPEKIASKIEDILKKLNVRYASIRSSAISEDSLKTSFAGLFDTYLNVKTELDLILENVKKCWSSLFNDRAVVYRLRKRIPHLEGMAVIVQEMVPAEVSGTVFTAHPDTKDRDILVIESSWGLGEAIVSGKVTPDCYTIDKNSLKTINRTLGRKKIIVKSGKNGIIQVDTPKNKTNMFSLKDAQLNNLSKICLNIEKTFSYPQDIEWSIQKNKIWVLQSRPVTSLGDYKI